MQFKVTAESSATEAVFLINATRLRVGDLTKRGLSCTGGEDVHCTSLDGASHPTDIVVFEYLE